MNKRIAIVISPNWHNYAKKYLIDCIHSLRQQKFDGQSKFFLVDNETSEESYEYLKNVVPEAEIIRNKNNDGFAKGNNDAMRLAIEQGYDYIFLINMDAVVDDRCLDFLIKEMETEISISAVQARLMLWSDKTKINSLGNVTHFLGFGYCQGYQEEYRPVGYKEIAYPSGAGVLLRSEALKKVGLFDEEMWMYNEDQDLGWRFWLAGCKCVLAEHAIVYHKYSFSKSIDKYYWMDRNRLINVFKNYRLATIILIMPALLFMEIGLFLFALKGGWIKDKIRVYKYFLDKKNWIYLKKSRQKSQAIRRVSDRVIIKHFSGHILYQEIDNIFLRIANVFFDFYWQLAKLLIIW